MKPTKAPEVVGHGYLGAVLQGLVVEPGIGVGRGLRAASRRPVLVVKVLAGGAAFVGALVVGEEATMWTLSGLVVAPAIWAAVHWESFRARVLGGLRATWRRSWGYKRSWDARMKACRLVVDERAPVLRSVTQRAWGESVVVKLPWGLSPDEVRHKAGVIATTFDKPLCRIREHKDRARLCVWEFSDGRALRDALPVPDFPTETNLEALHLGRREDGADWLLTVRHPERGYQHLFVAGETGAGKSSTFWQGFRELGPAIEAGQVELWVADPKFGQEFGKGMDGPSGPLFHRYADTDKSIAAMLSEAVARMRQNSEDMKAQRLDLHTPTRSMPAVLVVVDEVVSLLRDCEDGALAKQMERDMRLLLRMGRVFGVWMWAATQDSKVENFPLRDLFPTSIGLRLARANQVDMVFGKGARDDGATCDKIPKEMPGAGFEITEQGIWMVRSFHVTAEARAELLERYGRRSVLDQQAIDEEFADADAPR